MHIDCSGVLAVDRRWNEIKGKIKIIGRLKKKEDEEEGEGEE